MSSYKRRVSPVQPAATQDTPAEPIKPERLRSLAFALLAQREWSQQALQARLLETGADAEQVSSLVAELTEGGYQSDQRMAQMLVQSNIRRGRGPARIRQDCQKRQLNQELTQSSVAQTDWLTLARELRQRKFGADLPVDAKEKARQLRFLQYRGFGLDICLKALQVESED